MLPINSYETNATIEVRAKLNKSGMLIERVGDDAYNVISKATGAVMKRLVSATELAEYERCISYVAKLHGRNIGGGKYNYTMPVHNGLSNGRKRNYLNARV